MKRVSVVIPCYNAGDFLDEAVQSALRQTWPELEVVIVDDGSDDLRTRDLLDHCRWPRTRVLRQANAGPAAARNHAIRQACGDYILPLDADDTIEPTYAEKAVAVLDERPDVGCVYCKALKFGAETGPWELPPYRPEELAVDNVIFVSAMFRKSDWQAIGGFDEQLLCGVEDYDFWVKMVASGKVVVQLDEFLFNYRVQNESRTTQFQNGQEAKVLTYAQIFRNNHEFYAAYAETVFRHRFDLYEQLDQWRARCRNAEREVSRLESGEQIGRGQNEAGPTARLAYWVERYGEIDAFVGRHACLRRVLGKIMGFSIKRKRSRTASQSLPWKNDN